MAKVMKGRYTAQMEEGFVVFWIGMRINKIYQVHKWIPTMQAMVTMLKTLYTHPEKGFMGGQTVLSWRTIGLIQYWRSFEDLDDFARSPSEPHLPAWRKFNKAVGKDGSVGVFHETYVIAPGKSEALYANMPVFGLAAVTKHVKAVGKYETARRRMGENNEPAVVSPE